MYFGPLDFSKCEIDVQSVYNTVHYMYDHKSKGGGKEMTINNGYVFEHTCTIILWW